MSRSRSLLLEFGVFSRYARLQQALTSFGGPTTSRFQVPSLRRRDAPS